MRHEKPEEDTGSEAIEESSKPLTSRLPGLYRNRIAQRRHRVARAAGPEPGTEADFDLGLTLDVADELVENVVGMFCLPLGIATNFVIDGVERLIPMAIEEQSVIAGASNAALMVRSGGGFLTEAAGTLAIGQVELRGVSDRNRAIEQIRAHKGEILALCDADQPNLIRRGGGCRDLQCRPMPDDSTLVVHLLVDCADAMGAFLVTSMAQRVAPELARITGGRLGVRIVSNLADQRLVRARCRMPPEALVGEEGSGQAVRDEIVEATRLARMDPYRAVTHNKGILNGIDALLVATGNDWRAVEAGAHAYACRSGVYSPLSHWETGLDGWLEGRLELPMAVGSRSRVASLHPTVKLALKVLRVSQADELARIAAAVGLAQNLAALVALSTLGIAPMHR